MYNEAYFTFHLMNGTCNEMCNKEYFTLHSQNPLLIKLFRSINYPQIKCNVTESCSPTFNNFN